MVSLVVHRVQVHALQPVQASPPIIRKVSSKYRLVWRAMGFGKSVAEITKQDGFIRLILDGILLTISPLQSIQIENLHFLDVFAVVLPLLVKTPDHYNLSLARGRISDHAACVIKATMCHVWPWGPGSSGQVEKVCDTITCAVSRVAICASSKEGRVVV